MPEMPSTPNTPAAPVTAPVDAAKPVEGSKPAVTNEKMYTVKINGKEEQWPESKVLERAQKAEGAEKAMQTAAQLQKAFDNFVAQAQDPNQLLGLLNHPSMKYDEDKQEMLLKSMLDSKKPKLINAVKEWIYRNEIEPKTMDPKDLKLRELEAYRAQQEKIKAEQEAEQKSAAEKAAVQKAWTEYRMKIGEGIKANGLPETEATVARVARYALMYHKAGKPVDVDDCAKRVKADLIAEANERYSKADEDNILDLLPEGMAERINKALMKRLKKGDTGSGKPEAIPGSDNKAKPSAEETKEMMKKLARGGKVFE